MFIRCFNHINIFFESEKLKNTLLISLKRVMSKRYVQKRFYLILLVAVRIGRPVFVVPGPILKIFAGAGCCALNWNAFGGGV